jgi:diaminohydroxyphosphoribosylaminopyrimidine deaminase/5-amino-6-(5-phosphoribosylamino)uracil reductase
MTDGEFMKMALRLARRAYGRTSPNPMVGAVLVKRGRVIGRGWHHRAGRPHAEIEALRDAQSNGASANGATLYVTLEPCCTHGRTPPCTEAIIAAGIKKIVVATIDPNPAHAGRAFNILGRAGIEVVEGVRAEEAEKLNEAFNHWIVQHTPFVTVKAAMTLDGKIATVGGESKWITGEKARGQGMKLRRGADGILVGINTVLADDPNLTVRTPGSAKVKPDDSPRRFVLDSQARTPLVARVVTDEFADLTTIVVGPSAPKKRVTALAKRVSVMIAPEKKGRIDLGWLMQRLGEEEVTSVLVEGGGEVNAAFLLGGLAQRVAFFYAPKILGGRNARKSVSGAGVNVLEKAVQLREVQWKWLGPDLWLNARVVGK